jgi:adenylate cyclase
MADHIDFAAEGLLDGLEGNARAERIELLERLVADGYSLEDLKRAANVVLLPAESAVGGAPLYTARDIEERTGVEADFSLRLRRTIGLSVADADDRVFIERDLENAARVGAILQAGLTEQQLLDVSRVMGRSLSQVADTMHAVALELASAPGASEAELSTRYSSLAQFLTPMTAPLLEHVLLLHLRHSASQEMVNAAERQEGLLPGARDVTVAFADLVGFTRLGEKVDPEEVGRVAGRLERLAADIAVAPVRLVKTIGDAAMLASPEPEPLLDATLDLVAAAEEEAEDFPQLRAGVAKGPALQRAGDLYGRPVNLASRLTGVARPGSVLATKDVHDALEDNYQWSFAGPRPLKGIGEVPLYRARHLPDEEDDAGGEDEPVSRPRARARRRRRRS